MQRAVWNTIIGALCLAGIGILAWPYLAPNGAVPMTTEGMSRQELTQQSPMLLPAILTKVYTAFGETEEAAIYDKLAEVATGDALEQLYLERVGAMAGGGLNPDQAIHEVSLLGMSARAAGETVNVSARWRVLGVVGHDEHMHMRGNAYAADLVFARADGEWRISGFDLTDVDRTDAGTLERNADAPPVDKAEQES